MHNTKDHVMGVDHISKAPDFLQHPTNVGLKLAGSFDESSEYSLTMEHSDNAVLMLARLVRKAENELSKRIYADNSSARSSFVSIKAIDLNKMKADYDSCIDNSDEHIRNSYAVIDQSESITNFRRLMSHFSPNYTPRMMVLTLNDDVIFKDGFNMLEHGSIAIFADSKTCTTYLRELKEIEIHKSGTYNYEEVYTLTALRVGCEMPRLQTFSLNDEFAEYHATKILKHTGSLIQKVCNKLAGKVETEAVGIKLMTLENIVLCAKSIKPTCDSMQDVINGVLAFCERNKNVTANPAAIIMTVNGNIKLPINYHEENILNVGIWGDTALLDKVYNNIVKMEVDD